MFYSNSNAFLKSIYYTFFGMMNWNWNPILIRIPSISNLLLFFLSSLFFKLIIINIVSMKENYDKFSKKKKNRLFICFFYRIYLSTFLISVRSVILLFVVAIAVNLLIEGLYFPSNFFTPSDFSGVCASFLFFTTQ